MANISPYAQSSGQSAADNVFNQLVSLHNLNTEIRSHYQPEAHNNSLIVLNAGQNQHYAKPLIEFGYELLKKFENWNESRQPLYLYFKSGGPKVALPFPKVKDESPRKSSTASR